MLADAKRGMFNLIAVKDISRFARNTVDCLRVVRMLKREGITVRFLSTGQENMGESEFILTVFASLAQEESANLSKRVRFGKEINAQKGRVPPYVYGYDRIDLFTLRIREDEATVVKLIFQLYLSGFSSREIAKELKERHILTRKEKQWDSRGVRRCLHNSLYCGMLYNHKTVVTDFLEGTVKQLPQEDWYVHHRPDWGIVSLEEFAAVQIELARRRALYDGHDCGINRNT